MATKTVRFESSARPAPMLRYWENFELEWRPGMNVVSP